MFSRKEFYRHGRGCHFNGRIDAFQEVLASFKVGMPADQIRAFVEESIAQAKDWREIYEDAALCQTM